MRDYTAAHWGIYEVERGAAGGVALKPFAADPDPSPIGLAMLDACRARNRVRRPAVRRSWLERGPRASPERRGIDPFVEVSWDEALSLVADALRHAIDGAGNQAVFGGSYGWSSAGRFHHAQSQIHRFLNALGGYVRHVDSYSLGAGRVLMPQIVAGIDQLMTQHHDWDVLAAHTRLFVSFGGVPAKNAQISQGLVGEHNVRRGLQALRESGCRFVNVSPVRHDIDTGGQVEWIPIRPGTDVAMMLAMAYVIHEAGLHDRVFLDGHCTGFDRFVPYLTGRDDGQPKTPQWAEAITEVPAQTITALAHDLVRTRSMVTAAWSLQRSHHGEQTFWMLVTLAAMIGQIGLPGGGFGIGYGAINGIGNVGARFGGPTLPQGSNPVEAFIPVARIADMLERPGESFDYNGRRRTYPRIELVYWAGGNPFHHHQDLNRLLRAWRRPPAVIVNEQFWTATARLADIVLPATTTLERDDIGYSSSERYLVAMKRVMPPVGEARDDYDIFAELAGRIGPNARQTFTEGLLSAQWLRRLYEESRGRATAVGFEVPAFEAFWERGLVDLAVPGRTQVMLEAFRADPGRHPLGTPSGRIEIFSERIAGHGYDDCAGHPRWYEPVEWLGSARARRHPLHMLSDQPFTKLHSQLDHSAYSRANKIGGREPIVINAADAAQRGIRDGDLVEVFNDRGRCLAGARLSDAIRPGVVKLSTGAWLDPVSWSEPGALDKHGNPNVLTLDIGASRLSQGCVAQTCLVDVRRWDGEAPPLTAFEPPSFVRLERSAAGS